MISQTAKFHSDQCRFCWMCRHLCPVGLQTGREVNTPRAKGLLLSLVERGVSFDKEIASTMYECTLCGACTNDCVTGFDPPLYIRESRALAAAEDLAPDAVLKIFSNIESSGNIYGEPKPSFGAGNEADVLLYIGEVAACRQPGIARALMSLLKKAGANFMVLDEEPSSGAFLGELIGYVEEVREQASQCANAIKASRAKTVVVLDSYEAAFMKQQYRMWGNAPDCEIVTVTSYIEQLIEQKKLSPAKKSGIVTCHDSSRLARDLDEHEPMRSIITAMGYEIREMFLNRRLAKCCGSAVFKEYAPELTRKTAHGRWEDVIRTDSTTLVVACPEAFDVMSQAVPQGYALTDIFSLLDSACN